MCPQVSPYTEGIMKLSVLILPSAKICTLDSTIIIKFDKIYHLILHDLY